MSLSLGGPLGLALSPGPFCYNFMIPLRERRGGGLHRLSYPQDLSLGVSEWSHRTFFLRKGPVKVNRILPSVLLRPYLDCVLTSIKNNELVHAVRQWYILFVIIISERRLISEWKMCVVCQVYMKHYYYGSRVAQHADDCLQKSNSGIFKWSVCRSVAKNSIPWFILFTCLVPWSSLVAVVSRSVIVSYSILWLLFNLVA